MIALAAALLLALAAAAIRLGARRRTARPAAAPVRIPRQRTEES